MCAIRRINYQVEVGSLIHIYKNKHDHISFYDTLDVLNAKFIGIIVHSPPSSI